jgi:hypothetical protein
MRRSRDRCSLDPASGAARRRPWRARGARALFASLCACLIQVLPGVPSLRAEEQERPIVVILDAEDSPVTRRLRQEVEALGFSVQLKTTAPEQDASEELASARVVAWIEIKPARPGSVALSILDPKTDKIVRQALPIEAAQDPNAAELVATRTVELLRAARLNVKTRVPPRAQPVPLPPGPRTTPEQRAAQLQVGAGVGLSASAGWSSGFGASLNVAWLPSARFGAMAELMWPLTASRWQSAEGGIDGFANFYRLGAVFDALRGGTLGLRVSAGGEFQQLWFRGAANSPFINSEAHLSAWAPWLRVAPRLKLTASLCVVAAFMGAWTLPRSVVNFAGREVGRWGRPLLTGLGGVEWSFL